MAYVTTGVVLLLVLALVAVAVLVRQPFPQTEGELDPGRPRRGRSRCSATTHGIPQLYGDTTADLMQAQGFVHAQERFFEMDVRRHVTAGRLSEMFGEATLETDKFVRTLGWREVAEKEVALLEPETRVAFEAYADGVNAYLEQTDPDELAARVLRARRSTASTTSRSRGPPPTRSPGSRRWRGTCAATWTTRSTGCCRCR